jgi:Flp pilus assembly protein TadG
MMVPEDQIAAIARDKLRRRKALRRCRESGSVIVEFAMVLVPMLAMIFLLMDTAWLIFAKATLQEAVREGVRYGITGGAGCTSLNACIQSTIQQYSFGFVTSSNASSVITINYYSPTNTGTALSGCGATTGGNVVEVSVSGISLVPLAPLWRSSAPLNLSASSSDVMESGTNACP